MRDYEIIKGNYHPIGGRGGIIELLNILSSTENLALSIQVKREPRLLSVLGCYLRHGRVIWTANGRHGLFRSVLLSSSGLCERCFPSGECLDANRFLSLPRSYFVR